MVEEDVEMPDEDMTTRDWLLLACLGVIILVSFLAIFLIIYHIKSKKSEN